MAASIGIIEFIQQNMSEEKALARKQTGEMIGIGGERKELDLNSDPDKLKNEIKRWAKAVVAYARQLSGKFRSMSRQVSRRFSSSDRSSYDRDRSFSSGYITNENRSFSGYITNEDRSFSGYVTNENRSKSDK